MIKSSLSNFRRHWQIGAVAGLALVLFAGIVGAAMFGSGQERARHLRAFMATSISSARQLGEHARQSIAHADLALRTAQRAFEADVRSAKKRADAWRPSRKVHLRLRRLAAAVPQIASIRIVDASGVVRHSSLRVPAVRAKSEKTGYFRALKRPRNRRHVGTETVGAKRRRTFITVSRRLTGTKGKLVGVVTARLWASYFTRLYAAAARRRSFAAALIAPDGTVLASYPARSRDGRRVAARSIKEVPFLKDLPRLRVKRNRARGFSTERAVGAIYRDGNHNLRLAVTAPPDQALARWGTDFWYRLMIVGVVALLVCGFLILFTSQLLKDGFPVRAEVARNGRPAGPGTRPDVERWGQRDRRRRLKAAKQSKSSPGDGSMRHADVDLSMDVIVAKLTELFQRHKSGWRAAGKWKIGERAAKLSKLFRGDEPDWLRDDERPVHGRSGRDPNSLQEPQLSAPEKTKHRENDSAGHIGKGRGPMQSNDARRTDGMPQGEVGRQDRPAAGTDAGGPAETRTPPTFGSGDSKSES